MSAFFLLLCSVIFHVFLFFCPFRKTLSTSTQLPLVRLVPLCPRTPDSQPPTPDHLSTVHLEHQPNPIDHPRSLPDQALLALWGFAGLAITELPGSLVGPLAGWLVASISIFLQ